VEPRTSVQQLYGEVWADTSPLDGELERSLDPRGTEWLFDLFAELGPQPGELLVDVGTRDAKHAIRLVNEHGLRAIALDPVPHHVELARRAVAEAGIDLDVLEAGIEAMPIDDGVADWIWCRDVLVHVDLERGFAECARILRPGGQMLAYVTCSTATLEPREAETLFAATAVVPESTEPENIERRAADAGLTLVSHTPLAGEWRERMIEDGTWDPKDDLLRLSRLQRRSEELSERYGAATLAAYAAGNIWGIYQLLGKLRPTVYLWRRDA
jgi:ubiquinone/menaquinone biosynthesis C-methylase UbiE